MIFFYVFWFVSSYIVDVVVCVCEGVDMCLVNMLVVIGSFIGVSLLILDFFVLCCIVSRCRVDYFFKYLFVIVFCRNRDWKDILLYVYV